MTAEEFKSWFKGFNDALSGDVPTVEQYQAIKNAVDKIEVNKLGLQQQGIRQFKGGITPCNEDLPKVEAVTADLKSPI